MNEEWNVGEELSNLLLLEEPSASHLPCLVRYRAFTDPVDNNAAREAAWQTALPNSFCVHKRRRLEALGNERETVVRPLLRVLRDPIDVARRRLETFRWFEKPRGAEEIQARFALDRRLGVTPCLAAVHQALLRLKQLRRTEVVADLVEDLMMDSPALSICTLLHIVEGLKEQPERAARLVFTLAPLVTNGAVPASVWSSLCCELDKVARQRPAPLERSLVELFGQVLYRVSDDGPVSGSIVVYYGQALLKSRAPLRSIVGFVQTELLSGRNAPPSDPVSELRLGAFLSDLIEVMCGRPGEVAERDSGPPLSTKERLMYCGDLVKHAYAGRLQLTQAAFDAFLHFCDEEQDYHRLCIIFLAMCMLSTPTLLATTRVAEVLCDVEMLSLYLADLFHQPSPSLLLYVLIRHGGTTLFPLKRITTTTNNNNNNNNCNNNTNDRKRDSLELHLCECLARLCARDGDASLCMNTFAAIADLRGPEGAHAFICSLALAMRPPLQLFSSHPSTTGSVALEPFNLEALYYALRPAGVPLDAFCASLQTRPLASLFTLRDGGDTTDTNNSNGCGCTVERALSGLFATPQVYGMVVDGSAVGSLAKNVTLAEAFVKMMNEYAAKTGAVVLVHFDVYAAKQLTNDARQMLSLWLMQHSWFVPLPFSLAVRLVTTTATGSHQQQPQREKPGVQLFHEMRRMGHTKVAFITAEPHIAEEVKAEGVHPVITLAELKVRLGLR
ncbi:hypothetical protein DQ04_00291130 [Trypanosoma grayi]|uniref:hypothetical protein n=1 Tax=Trypanosoma grayi TaxID=71804 RepID=UPI0004F45DD0|nr:hypothetical protein DQ04_00291130 [Trypanosoma grayi]KEG14827.1 hypothetical protein DQ04_00291130 [Trypanosoma grayi]